MAEIGRLRRRKISVYLSEGEFLLLADKTERSGSNVSELIRSLIADGLIINYQTIDIKNVIYELNKIGSNINQIAKHCNEICAVSISDFNQLKSEYARIEDSYIKAVTDLPKLEAGGGGGQQKV